MQKNTSKIVQDLAELLAVSHQVLEDPTGSKRKDFDSLMEKHTPRRRVLREDDLINLEVSPHLTGRDNHRHDIPIALEPHEQRLMRVTGVKKMLSALWLDRPLLLPTWCSAVMLASFVLLGSVLSFGLIRNHEQPTMVEFMRSQEEVNEDAFLLYINDAWNLGKVEVLNEIFTADHVGHNPLLAEDMTGVEGTQDLIARLRAALPDLQIVIEATAIESDSVWAQLTLTGTHTQPFELADGTVIPASNQPVALAITNFSRFKDGRIVEMWEQMDTLKLLQQMGIVPQIRQLSTEEQNKEAVRFIIEELWGGQGEVDIEIARQIIADSFEQTSNCLIGTGSFGPFEVKSYLDMFHRAFPDGHFTVESLIAEGDLVVVRFTFNGVMEGNLTLTSSFRTMSPTHEEMVWHGIHMSRFEGGKSVEGWWYWDIPGEAGNLLCN